jgi:hypothetical protein
MGVPSAEVTVEVAVAWAVEAVMSRSLDVRFGFSLTRRSA